jgi:hypothetical protein
MMLRPPRAAGASLGTYSGFFDALAKTVRKDGVLALYNGGRRHNHNAALFFFFFCPLRCAPPRAKVIHRWAWALTPRPAMVCVRAGFGPNFMRLGSWNTAMFLVLEQVKQNVFGAKPANHH